ncbi:MAG: hypothetical protein C4325_12345 [Blastocatellia bacterium]
MQQKSRSGIPLSARNPGLYVKFASMRKVLSTAEMRQVDRLTTETVFIPSVLLMEMAANSVVREITRCAASNLANNKISVFCGKGNNGGDGFAISRILYLLGADVRVFLVFPEMPLRSIVLSGRYRQIDPQPVAG